MTKKLKLAVIGLGKRGKSVIKNELLRLTDKMEIIGLCDVYPDRLEKLQNLVEEAVGYRPAGTTHSEALWEMKPDAVFIATSWEDHIPLACAAMERGIYVGMEVGGAYSIEDCRQLIRTYERTKTPCFLVENCCYGKRELVTKVMAEQGFFGEIVHCQGSYSHDLRKQIAEGEENRHYRLRNYLNRNCDNYPTHALVPLGKVLKINEGNRFVSLTSTASCAKAMNEFVRSNYGEDHPLAHTQFNQGDVVTTVIKCASGATVTLRLDTTVPRPYSRNYTIQGTKAAFFEDTDMVFEDARHYGMERARDLWGNFSEYEERFLHPLWQNYDASGGHGGMDYLAFSAFIEYASKGWEPPVDVYDTATYMAITALSEQSIAQGSAPVAVPDFTCGNWHKKKEKAPSDYAL